MTGPAFQVGERVRIADRTPPVHHRVPAYVKGHEGVIERVRKIRPQWGISPDRGMERWAV